MKLSCAVAAAAASALLTVTACGSSDSLGADSETATSSSGSGQGAQDERTDETAPTQPVGDQLDEESFLPTVIDAQLEASTTQLDMTMDLAGQPITMTGELEAADSLESSAMQFEVGIPGGGDLEMILVDEVLYLNAGPATGDRFLKLRLDDPAAEQYLNQLQGQLNPAEMTRALEGALTGFEAAGTDTVGGQETSRYVLEVDTAEVLASGGVTEVPGFELPTTMRYTFWLDDEHLPVRISMDLGDLGVVEMNFSGWGEPVDIQAPPRSQITRRSPFAAPA